MSRSSRPHPSERRQFDLSLPEMDALHYFLGDCLGEIDNFDMLDGLFTALQLAPEPEAPPAAYPEIFGVSDMLEEIRRLDRAEQSGYLDLILRHWEAVGLRLQHGGAWYPPVSDASGNREADWARGFEMGFDVVELWWEARGAEAHLKGCVPSLDRLLEDERNPSPDVPRLTDAERVDLIRSAVREIGELYIEMRWRG